MNLRKHVRCFFKLICKPRIREFLNMDPCNAIVDKYLLIGVFIYFIRAHFEAKDYTTRNFYIALYLCHEIHEEILLILSKSDASYRQMRNEALLMLQMKRLQKEIRQKVTIMVASAITGEGREEILNWMKKQSITHFH
ncbi:speedy protein 1-A isoform X3 [Coccinella septempunctata]|uniref:speedy protein 1-A isoform X3 n=1 Tax=Coccinella septempunctata TaxID=41139 RepID=UPI001D0891F5|nr:speedy protein 1-A isoform X3 [Coccinella septempunctata]